VQGALDFPNGHAQAPGDGIGIHILVMLQDKDLPVGVRQGLDRPQEHARDDLLDPDILIAADHGQLRMSFLFGSFFLKMMIFVTRITCFFFSMNITPEDQDWFVRRANISGGLAVQASARFSCRFPAGWLQ
jgi:hypothetical protein